MRRHLLNGIPRLPFAIITLVVCCRPALADDSKSSSSSSEPNRVALAKPAESGGILLARERGKEWKVVGNSDSIYSEDMLLVLPAGRATFISNNKAVTLSLWGNLPLSNVPIDESAVVLHENADVDVDVTLDRGRLLITNSRSKGDAKVRVHVLDQTWNLTLREPGSSAALELFARMPPGTTYKADAKKPAKPSVEVGCLVTKGSVEFRQEQRMVLLQEPPGPASVRWFSNQGNEVNAMRLTKLPPWIEEGTPFDKTAYINTALKHVADEMQKKPVVAE